MLLLRTVIAVAMIALGGVILARMIVSMPTGRFETVPGVILGLAMVALGAHRLKLIARVRRL